jgi:hypothetical protein
MFAATGAGAHTAGGGWSRTENRFPLFLELLLSVAIPDGKPLPTFPGIAFERRNSGRKSGSHFS